MEDVRQLKTKEWSQEQTLTAYMDICVLHCARYVVVMNDRFLQQSSYSKISQLWIHIRIQENIGWFNIHMDNVFLM